MVMRVRKDRFATFPIKPRPVKRATFEERVRAGCKRWGLSLTWTRMGRTGAVLIVRSDLGREDSPARSYALTDITDRNARGPHGTTLTAADVVVALRRQLARVTR